MSFKLGQVGHHDLGFVYMRRQWRSRSLVFGSVFGFYPAGNFYEARIQRDDHKTSNWTREAATTYSRSEKPKPSAL